ncbi:C-type lectin 10, partial [Operophtera brumata]
QSSKTCLTWEKGNAELTSKCNEKLPYVCYKSQKEEAPECGTPDTGGYLAIINSPLESVVLKELFANNPENIRNCLSQTNPAFSFIGIRDWLDGESWRSVKGQSLTDVGFMGWASGEPNNDHGGIEHCISITRSGTYNDYCCVSLLTFICEKEPKPECY